MRKSPKHQRFRNAIKQYQSAKDRGAIQSFLKSGSSVDQGLAYALEDAKPLLVRYFLKQGANPNGIIGTKTMMMRAIDAKERTWDMMLILRRAGVKETSGMLHYAVKANNYMAVRMLMDTVRPGDRIIKYARNHGYMNIHAILNSVAKTAKKPPPCTHLHMMHLDTRAKSPGDMVLIEKVHDDLGVCMFADSILRGFTSGKIHDFFLAFDIHGTCVAAASADLYVPIDSGLMMYVEYLCSAKTCTGAGSRLLQYMESFARNGGMDFVGLTAIPSAIPFYNKQRYVRVAGGVYGAANTAGATRQRFSHFLQFIKRVSRSK